MTEWDHGAQDGPDHDPGGEPDRDAAGSEPPAHLSEPSGLGDPYGSPAEPGPNPHTPDAPAPEPAGLPEEQPADWSAGPEPGDPADWHQPGDPADWHQPGDPAAWDQPNGAFDPSDLDPGDLSDGTDPAGWTAAAAAADPFPAALDVDVQPGDGGPWVDPDLLGGSDHGTGSGPEPAPVDPPAALLPDLAGADGDPDAGWDALRDSDDPAVRALTLHWNPDPPGSAASAPSTVPGSGAGDLVGAGVPSRDLTPGVSAAGAPPSSRRPRRPRPTPASP